LGGSSQYLHRAFWNGCWKQSLKTVGQCNEYSHRTNTQYIWDILESNLFGDPTVSFVLAPTPPNDGPKANFTFTKNGDDEVSFTDTSTCSGCVINAWAWDFGDGTTSQDKNTVHTYAKMGTYTVKLTVTADNAKTSSITKTVQLSENSYVLTVNNGSGGGDFESGATVTIKANAAPSGKAFDKWEATSGNPVIANVSAATTTLTMPANAATVTATYKIVPGTTYPLTVNSGTGGGDFESGATVTITANAAPQGQKFSQWVATSGNPVIANPSATTTTLTMPAGAATVTATYKPSSSSSNSLVTNGTLVIGESLRSSTGQSVFLLQSGGDMVHYRLISGRYRPLWNSNTYGKGGVRLILQSDGNLVLYTSSNAAVWASNTAGSGANLLRLNDNGSLVLYRGSTVVKAIFGKP
jgi:PKD repeat protein